MSEYHHKDKTRQPPALVDFDGVVYEFKNFWVSGSAGTIRLWYVPVSDDSRLPHGMCIPGTTPLEACRRAWKNAVE